MGENIELQAYGRVDLDGTHRAVVETELSGLDEAEADDDGRPRFLRVTSGDKVCGCLLAEVRKSRTNKIFIDRFKQWHLGIRDGDPVTVREIVPEYASRIKLKVPAEFGKQDEVRFIGKPLMAGEKTALFTFGGETRLVVVTRTEPEGVVTTTPATEILTSDARSEDLPASYDDIGGLEREVRQIREVVEVPLRHPELFDHLGVSPPRGIILHGPPGTGKTLIARALANETGARLFTISGPEVYSKWYGKSEENLRNIFSEAIKNAPSIVLIDELDALVPIRDKTHGDQEQRIVATFLTQMDGLKEMREVVVVATTNRVDAVDPALRRGGRFEYEVHIGVPDTTGRRAILQIHTRKMPLTDEVHLDAIAERTVGHVGADLASVCREAAFNAIRRCLGEDELMGGPIADRARINVCQQDFERAVSAVPPSAMKELAVEVPGVSWDDVGGLDEVKTLLVENISNAWQNREAFRKVGLRPAGGILLFGPPGTGKTLLARAVASECATNFISIKGPEIRSRWIGEAEERIRFLFSKARQVSPCVLFFDELDAAVPVRTPSSDPSSAAVVNQILAEMDGIDAAEGVFVMGATNRVEAIDPAVMRPGRFDHIVRIVLPDDADRRAIFDVHLRSRPVQDGVDMGALVERTAGFCGAEIAEICRRAAWSALKKVDLDAETLEITQDQLIEAVYGVARSREIRLAVEEASSDKVKP